MGIHVFTSKEEYALLCILLMFLEDRDAGEQFILSQLTEYIASNMPGEGVDWTLLYQPETAGKGIAVCGGPGAYTGNGRKRGRVYGAGGWGGSVRKHRSFQIFYAQPSVGILWSTAARRIFRRATGFAVDEDRGHCQKTPGIQTPPLFL